MKRLSHNNTLPPHLMTSEVGSFAQKTIIERKPQIIQRVISDNQYPASITADLQMFADEIASKPVSFLHDKEPDTDFWNAHWMKYEGKSWLEIPWYFAETYFYRRLLEAVKYLQPGVYFHRDPFLAQKIVQENTALDQLARSWLLSEFVPVEERFMYYLHASLWGNRADLSNFTVKETAQQGQGTQVLRQHIIIDDTQITYQYLCKGVHELAFVNDNVGADSINDLVLADFLLSHNWAQTVVFHLKNRPFFVSDAMPADIIRVIQKMASAAGPLQPLGKRLSSWVQDGKLQLLTDPFWVSCLTFTQLSTSVREELIRADLTILKGDVNYRRLLDDRHWDPTADVEVITRYFPKPFLILRTLKGEIIAGLAEGQAERIAFEDPTWLINGKRGIIQLVGNS